MKVVSWLGNSLDSVKNFTKAARAEVGYQLYQIQNGTEPDDWKPIKTVGPGVREIRIHSESEYRVLYLAKFEEAVYVLHAFNKKTQRTSESDIRLANRRLSDLTQWRRRNGYD